MVIDHWSWCVAGLRGIVQMLTKLMEGKIPPSENALTELEDHITELQKILETAKTVSQT